MVFRCNTVAQAICTIWCILCVALLGVGTFMTHRAFSTLIPPVVDMPENLREGLNQVLNFDSLEASAGDVKTLSAQALAKCQLTEPAVGCALEPPVNPATHNVSEQVDGISAAFEDVLNEIKKVTTDKYLGIEDFDATAGRLEEMRAKLESLKGQSGSVECTAIVSGFCAIWQNGDEIVDSMDEVRAALDKITENDAVKTFEQYGNLATSVHIIPYVGWAGIIFYVCFFLCSEKVVTICQGGSCGACVVCICHSLFFVIFLVIATLIAGAAVAGSVFAQDYAVEEPFRGKPTIAELVDHIKEKFPEFYDLVLKELISGLEATRNAFVVNAGACILLTFHTIFACCCGIYDNTRKASL